MKEENNEDILDRICVRTLYDSDANWKNVVQNARSILSKTPPKKFTDKWNMLGDKSFIELMKESDNDAVVTVKIAMSLVKGKKITDLYWADNWELLGENINLLEK